MEEDINKTSAYNENENTSHYNDDGDAFKKISKAHQISIGDIITLKEKDYRILNIISEGTGEAVIYKIADNKDDIYALKLYYEFLNNKEEPGYETLRRILALDDPDILKLYDFGAGQDKYQAKYCYEITAFAQGGDLLAVDDFKKKYTPDFIENYIIPEIYKGINVLHENKIYHCDLKPANVFYIDRKQNNIVIGDYGSAKAYDLDSEKDVRKSSTVKGTQFYIAPEQALGFISDKNDYYSFGMIILHLLYPESLCSDGDFRNLDRKKYKAIAERQFNEIPLWDFNNTYKRLNTLIEGLTLHNFSQRWSKKEVQRWLNKEDVAVNYRAVQIIPVKLGTYTIKNEKDLIHYLEKNDKWYEELIEEQDTYATFKRWLDEYKDIPTRRLVDDVIKFYAPSGIKFIKEALIRIFQPYRPIFVDIHIFKIHESTQIEQTLAILIAQLDKIYKILQANEIKYIIFQIEFTLKHLHEIEKDIQKKEKLNDFINKLFKPFSINPENFNYKTQLHTQFDTKRYKDSLINLVALFYEFNPQRKFITTDNTEITDLDGMALFFAAHTDAMENPFMEAEKQNYLLKNGHSKLLELSAEELVYEVFRKQAVAEIELISVNFDKEMNFEVTYTFNKSLNYFLNKKNINNDFTLKSEKREIFTFKKKKYQTYAYVFKSFINHACAKHKIATLPNKNIRLIKSKFRKQVSGLRKTLFRKQNIALVLFIICLLLMAAVIFKVINIDHNWKFKLGQIDRKFLYNMLYSKSTDVNNNDLPETTPDYYLLYKLTSNDVNIRSGPGTQYKSIGKARKDEVFEVIDNSNTKWYKVNYGTQTGYIHSKYLIKI